MNRELVWLALGLAAWAAFLWFAIPQPMRPIPVFFGVASAYVAFKAWIHR